MRTRSHALPSASAGTERRLRSLHFGRAENGRKAYVQAALHADEVPPLLVAQALASRLAALEDAGAIAGEIVLVPMANPIGLSQEVLGEACGRFALSTGKNFNRDFHDLAEPLAARVEGRLGDDLDANTRVVRAAARELLEGRPPKTEPEALKHLLQTLAVDADLVLDLHCDLEAVVHLYTGTPQVEAFKPLAGYLGARALLTSESSSGTPFEEANSRHWAALARHFDGRFPIDRLACLAATVELRGQAEVSQALAEQDADALVAFLQQRGHIDGQPAPPPAACNATPLEGVQPVTAPVSGIVVFDKAPGDWVVTGERVAEIVDPLTDERTPLKAEVTGRCFARTNRRYATLGMRLMKIAGPVPYRSGNLLSP
jgi:predicted deacylase